MFLRLNGFSLFSSFTYIVVRICFIALSGYFFFINIVIVSYLYFAGAGVQRVDCSSFSWWWSSFIVCSVHCWVCDCVIKWHGVCVRVEVFLPLGAPGLLVFIFCFCMFFLLFSLKWVSVSNILKCFSINKHLYFCITPVSCPILWGNRTCVLCSLFEYFPWG